ncbi:hypothetical protein ACOME3_008823 [Neoechinorhynchus agilis]
MSHDIDDGIYINYVPWWPIGESLAPHERFLLYIIKLAYGDLPTMHCNGGVDRSPIPWPDIPNIRYVNGRKSADVAEVDRIGDLTTSANMIYETAMIWCHRLARQDIFLQAVQVYTQLYWKVTGRPRHLVLGTTNLTIALPKAAMRGYLMCPLLQYRDTAEQLVSVVGPCAAHDLVIEATMSALLIGFSSDMIKWSLVDYGLLYTRPRVDQASVMASMLTGTGGGGGGGGIWALVNKNLNDLGYKGAVGKHLPTVFSINLPRTFLHQAKIARDFRILSYDLLGWFPALPEGCAARELCKDGNMLAYIMWSGWSTPCLFRSECCQLRPDIPLHPYAGPVDYPHQVVTLITGDRFKYGFRPNGDSLPALYHVDHDRFHLEWSLTHYCPNLHSIAPMMYMRMTGLPDDYMEQFERQQLDVDPPRLNAT